MNQMIFANIQAERDAVFLVDFSVERPLYLDDF